MGGVVSSVRTSAQCIMLSDVIRFAVRYAKTVGVLTGLSFGDLGRA